MNYKMSEAAAVEGNASFGFGRRPRKVGGRSSHAAPAEIASVLVGRQGFAGFAFLH